MLPNWLIKKKNKEKFIQEQLQIEVPQEQPIKEEKVLEKDDIDRGVTIIELF